MTKYHINYLTDKIEKTFEINNSKYLVWLIPNNKNDMKKTWDYLNSQQIDQLDNLLYKKPDSCFYDEIKSYDSILINQYTLSSNYSLKEMGILFIFDVNHKIIGFLSYQLNNNNIFIENVCINKNDRGKGIFKIIFNWFINQIKLIHTNLVAFKLTVWQESPFNKDNKIVELYKKFGFIYNGTEKYSDKRTYIHMKKNIN